MEKKGLIDFIEEIFMNNNEFSSTTEMYLFWSIFFVAIVELFIFILWHNKKAKV